MFAFLALPKEARSTPSFIGRAPYRSAVATLKSFQQNRFISHVASMEIFALERIVNNLAWSDALEFSSNWVPLLRLPGYLLRGAIPDLRRTMAQSEKGIRLAIDGRVSVGRLFSSDD
jgi:hypothetical protein